MTGSDDSQVLWTPDDLHLWRFNAGDWVEVESPERNLSTDERQRAARFRFPIDRRRFAVFRSFLRLRLAQYLKVSPAEVRFVYGPADKPRLDPRYHGTDVRFNVAHCGDVGLFAFARSREVGVDVEKIRTDLDFPGLARTCFSRREYLRLDTCLPGERARIFFEVWTRKEAYLKALGCGLTVSLDQIDTLPNDDSFLDPSARRPAADGWTYVPIVTSSCYAEALVIEGAERPVDLRCFPLAVCSGSRKES